MIDLHINAGRHSTTKLRPRDITMSTPVRWPSIILNSIYIHVLLYIHIFIVSGCNTYQQHIVFYHTYNIASRKSGSKISVVKGSMRHRSIPVGNWMSRKGSDRINGWDQRVISYNPLINGVYWGYSPLTNLLPTINTNISHL